MIEISPELEVKILIGVHPIKIRLHSPLYYEILEFNGKDWWICSEDRLHQQYGGLYVKPSDVLRILKSTPHTELTKEME